MIIDSHLHIDLRGYTEEKLLSHLSKNRIDRAWILSWEEENPQFTHYFHVSKDRILEICDKYPDKFIPFYAPDPGRKDIDEKLKILNASGFKGVGELKVVMQWKDEAIERLLKGMTQKVLIFHMQDKRYYSSSVSVKQKILRDFKNERFTGAMKKLIGKSVRSGLFDDEEKKLKYFPGYLSDFDGLEMRLNQFPNISFIAHAWLFWSNIDGNYSTYRNLDKRKIKSRGIIWNLLENYPNLHCDISAGSGWNALTRDRSVARKFLETFSEKILFGTDNADYDFIGLVKSFKLSRSQEEAIFFRNSEKLLS
jgi:predicted TIM-barrel fold metal-dependent hydrolase